MEEEENQKHIEQTYLEKSKNILYICIGILAVSFLTYIWNIVMYLNFDYGVLLEIVSCFFIISACVKIGKKEIELAKTYIIVSAIPMFILIVIDLIDLLSNIGEVIGQVGLYYLTGDFLFYFILPYLFDVTLYLNVFLLYKAYTSLGKAEGKIKKSFTDTFYDSL